MTRRGLIAISGLQPESGNNLTVRPSAHPRFRQGTLLAILFSLTLVPVGAPAQEKPRDPGEPPARLKKKERPQTPAAPDRKPAAPPQKAEPPAKTENPPSQEEAQDAEKRLDELLSRLGRNFRVARQQLGGNDPGEGTQQVQQDIIKDLDDLIQQSKRQQQQQQDQGQSSSSSQQTRSDQRRGSARQQNTSAAQRQQTRPGRRSPEAVQQPRGGNSSRADMSRIADLYKDVWGNLPETSRLEMDQYSREQFMDKYKDLLKQYYATVAEKARKDH